jgi:hypothetical protein
MKRIQKRREKRTKLSMAKARNGVCDLDKNSCNKTDAYYIYNTM